MQFYDLVEITVESGRGGDGAATGRKEKYVPYGGPSGGDGGDGGSVFFVATKNEYTLLPYRGKKKHKAGNGNQGQGKDMYGKKGDDCILYVPVGTLLKDTQTQEILCSLDVDGQSYCAALGGRGGAGNKHFVTPKKQFSSIALLGEPQQKITITLELQLLGDIGLVGVPSVGKSSIINLVTNVKAKTAEYHFTTITPHLGIATQRGIDFSLIDIPGLIEGAHEGKGLGNEFLRHIVKSSMLFFVVSIDQFENGMKQIPLLIEEIILYVKAQHFSKGPLDIDVTVTKDIATISINAEKNGEKEKIFEKKRAVLVNKIDIVSDSEIIEEYCLELAKVIKKYISSHYQSKATAKNIHKHIFTISAATGKGKDPFLDYCIRSLPPKEEINNSGLSLVKASIQNKETTIENITAEAIPFLQENGYLSTEKEIKQSIRYVDHDTSSYLAFVLPRGNDEAELWFWSCLEKEGLLRQIEKLGAKKGDIFQFPSRYQGVTDKRVVRE